MLLCYEYTTRVTFSPAVGQHNILLRCLPSREVFQRVCRESFSLSEGFWHKESLDGQGNRILVGGTSLLHDSMEYVSSGIVDTSVYCLPDALPHPMYALQSSQTQPSQEMHTLLPALTGHILPDSLAIAHRVHRHIVYTPCATHMLTSASEVYRLRKGVCQDYAHLMITLCRMAGMHARYVCGLMMGEGQTHAWVEVHDGQCWYAFDPTNDTAVATGYIKLAHGRDALDCPVARGLYHGVAQEHMLVNVTVSAV